MDPTKSVDSPGQSALLRLYWMALGPVLLFLMLVGVVNSTSAFYGWDAAFFAILLLHPVARWIEFRRGGAQTAYGEPAGPEHLRAYLFVILFGGPLVWLVTRLVGRPLLGPE